MAPFKTVNLTVSSNASIGTSLSAYGNLTIFGDISGYNLRTSFNTGSATGDYSFAEGQETLASGNNSHAEGILTQASGSASHAEGSSTTASGNYSHAEGYSTLASGGGSHAEGSYTESSGNNTHAEGFYSKATNNASHAEGNWTEATGEFSHAEGDLSIASNYASHAEGGGTQATGEFSHAEGDGSIASGYGSHSEGGATQASGGYSHSEGNGTKAFGNASHAEGVSTKSGGDNSHTEGFASIATETNAHAEGFKTFATGEHSHAEGVETATGQRISVLSYSSNGNASIFTLSSATSSLFSYVINGATYLAGYGTEIPGNSINRFCVKVIDRDTTTGTLSTEIIGGYSINNGILLTNSGYVSHAEGYITTASGQNSHAEGASTTASGSESHAEGQSSTASGWAAHAEGGNTQAIGGYSHSEGRFTISSGDFSHAEGFATTASGQQSHAEGSSTTASGNSSHAEGSSTTASGQQSHAEGSNTTASNRASHAEGVNTTASGDISHAEGWGTQAIGGYSHAAGIRAIAQHSNSWIWRGMTTPGYFVTPADAQTTRSGQFLVSAEGGVFIPGKIGFGVDPLISGLTTNELTILGDISANGNHTFVSNSTAATVTIRQNSHNAITFDMNGNVFEVIGGYGPINSISYFPIFSITKNNSIQEGFSTIASGRYSHAEGQAATASGTASHAEGNVTQAIGGYSHSEGTQTLAYGMNSHAEGQFSRAYGSDSHAEGNDTLAIGVQSHAEGAGSSTGEKVTINTFTSNATAGIFTFSSANSSKFSYVSLGTLLPLYFLATPYFNSYRFSASVIARDSITGTLSTTMPNIGGYGFSSGYFVTTNGGSYAHAEGQQTTSIGQASHSEGMYTTASGNASHAEGAYTIASSNGSHAEGTGSTASAWAAHAEGGNTQAIGGYSHAEGFATTASGQQSHAEGSSTTASGQYSHSEGISTLASNAGSHSEGGNTQATGGYSHAEGYQTTSSGPASHAEGWVTQAIGGYSHAAGLRAVAQHENSWIWRGMSIPSYFTNNIQTTRPGQFMVSAEGGVFIPGNVGIGTDNNSNALTVNGTISSNGIVYGLGGFVGPTINSIRISTVGANGVGGGFNTFIGQNTPAQFNSLNVVANRNTIVGYAAGQPLSTGKYNSFFGVDAGRNTDTGEFNTAIGNAALNSQPGSGNGFYNTALGQSAGVKLLNGLKNTFVGHLADVHSTNTVETTGNIVIGVESNAGGFNNTIVIGREAEATKNNDLQIGSANYPVSGVLHGSLSATKYLYSVSLTPNLPVPKIKLMSDNQYTGPNQTLIQYVTGSSIDNNPTWGIGGNLTLINSPYLVVSDFTQEDLNTYQIFIEMVMFKRTRFSGSNRTSPKISNSSYTTPNGNTTPPWGNNFWQRSGDAPTQFNSPKGAIVRKNHIPITSLSQTIPLSGCLNGHFKESIVKYADPTSVDVFDYKTLTCITPFGGSNFRPNGKFGYGRKYRPLYVAFRYICWLPKNNNGKGQIISGPLSQTIRISNLRFAFKPNHYQSSLKGFPVVDVNQDFETYKTIFKCQFC